MTPEETAQRSAEAMWADDRASQSLGMTVSGIGPGRATVTMTVRPDMVNGHAIGHGGYTFTLADTAFAFACNSYNRATVAATGSIRFRRPTQVGDVLVAQALERHREGRHGTYDVVVRCGDEVVAEFEGHSKEIGGNLFREDTVREGSVEEDPAAEDPVEEDA